MKLVIVESPTKAKTISKFLDKNYLVESSYGHIRDLPRSKLGIDVENNFEPDYVVPVKNKATLKISKRPLKSDGVILATDEDREGEAIAWHLAESLKLGDEGGNRIVFHEITKPAIEEALKHPRSIDRHLVDAQQARRILDRLVGYKLSPFLWKSGQGLVRRSRAIGDRPPHRPKRRGNPQIQTGRILDYRRQTKSCRRHTGILRGF